MNYLQLRITDDSGFLAIVNSNTYLSFVDENWDLPLIIEHFIAEMNHQHIIFWATGAEDEWIMSFSNQSSGQKSFREFSSIITVTNEKLYLTNFEDLTMAAQFRDEKVPSNNNSDLAIPLENGQYLVTVRQLFDPENYMNNENGQVNFEIVLQIADQETEKIDRIFWWKE